MLPAVCVAVRPRLVCVWLADSLRSLRLRVRGNQRPDEAKIDTNANKQQPTITITTQGATVDTTQSALSDCGIFSLPAMLMLLPGQSTRAQNSLQDKHRPCRNPSVIASNNALLVLSSPCDEFSKCASESTVVQGRERQKRRSRSDVTVLQRLPHMISTLICDRRFGSAFVRDGLSEASWLRVNE